MKDEHAKTFQVLGIAVNALTMESAIASTERLVDARRKGYLVFCTVSTLLNARKTPQLVDAIENAALVTPDGMPLVWVGNREEGGEVSRVYGPDFLIALIEATGSRFRHFFYGGGPGTAERMADALKERFPDLVVAGTDSPPYGLSSGKASDEVIDRINGARPDIVWVGLGHPKQELWMRSNQPWIEAPVLAGVGAAFDFLSGEKREAPGWIRKAGLQWLHRLISEPRRLWRRYLIGNTLFILLLARERLARREKRS